MILALNRLFSLATENNFTNDQEFSLTVVRYDGQIDMKLHIATIRLIGQGLSCKAFF